MRQKLLVLRVELEIRRRILGDRIRWRLLRAIPSRVLYWTTLQATIRTLRSDEHPDSIGALEVARRLG
jgi:hypothetical protein